MLRLQQQVSDRERRREGKGGLKDKERDRDILGGGHKLGDASSAAAGQ